MAASKQEVALLLVRGLSHIGSPGPACAPLQKVTVEGAVEAKQTREDLMTTMLSLATFSLN